MFGNRDQLRRQFIEAWAKARDGRPLDGLDAQLAQIIREHPEYHDLLADPEQALQAEFPPEAGQSNPFLHLAMHLSIREQAATDRPAGIREIHRRLGRHLGVMEAEHRMLECLGQALWEAQRAGSMPDENAYLECLRRIEG
ncbi:DUF1841 family protein [Thioalkalivibrio paradoxus]|uniref:DUF1841 domain-containing protein n=1 Tax=Thioalkalivibrio paradoxus ARh 1 TaxID=713585 RepID=W0DGW1_9GAMM|nr:DUF1841 family protein [Thioalkalivibrio paradoxus]AHE97616.1 hypothetical protein THITH_04350 [Thioalkalivibrio paradoxus ARh 1]